MIARDFPVVIVGNANIQQDIHDKGKIEQRKIKAIHLFTHPILHRNFNPKKPEWLNEDIKDDKQDKI